jgi:hypothetical protein
MHYRKIVLMKHRQSARLEHTGTPLEDFQRVFRVNQNVPSNNRIEPAPRIPVVHVALDAVDVAQHLGARPPLERL